MKRKIDLAWTISLMVIGILTLVIIVTNIVGIEMPDTVRRIIGVGDLIALFLLVYSSVIKFKNNPKR